MKKRTLTAILAVLLCLTLLTGCGGASQAARTTETPHLTQAAQSKEDQPAQTPAAQGTALSGQMGYQTRYLEMADDGITAALSNGTDAGNAIYFTSLGVIADETPEGVTPEWEGQYLVYGPILLKAGRLNGANPLYPGRPG